jgi:plasmid stabilization system protein ParE
MAVTTIRARWYAKVYGSYGYVTRSLAGCAQSLTAVSPTSKPDERSHSPRISSATLAIVGDFRGALDVLATFPHAGREWDELRPNLRSYVAHPYLVFYRVDDALLALMIVRFLPGLRLRIPYRREPTTGY